MACVLARARSQDVCRRERSLLFVEASSASFGSDSISRCLRHGRFTRRQTSAGHLVMSQNGHHSTSEDHSQCGGRFQHQVVVRSVAKPGWRMVHHRRTCARRRCLRSVRHRDNLLRRFPIICHHRSVRSLDIALFRAAVVGAAAARAHSGEGAVSRRAAVQGLGDGRGFGPPPQDDVC